MNCFAEELNIHVLKFQDLKQVWFGPKLFTSEVKIPMIKAVSMIVTHAEMLLTYR